MAIKCSHYYVAYQQFEVAEDDGNEGALRCAARMSSGRDLVEEFVRYRVWPLVHGWALGKVCLGDDFVRRAALCGSLGEALLSALAEKENWT